MFSKKNQKGLTVCPKWQLPNKSKAFSTISEVSLIPYYKQLVLANTAGTGRHWDGNSGSTLYCFLSSKSTMSELEAPSCLWLLFSPALLENKISHVCYKKHDLSKHFPSPSILPIPSCIFTEEIIARAVAWNQITLQSLWSIKTQFNKNEMKTAFSQTCKHM